MKLIKKKFVCPYCFSKEDLYRIQFRCQNYRCRKEKDKKQEELTGNSDALNIIFDIPQATTNFDKLKSLRLPKKVACPECNEDSTIRVCPNCHSELPYTIGDYKDLIFAIIGAKESGKSHYISVLINTIENHIGKNFNANLQKLDDETIRKYREEFYNPIFVNKEVIAETKSARGNYNIKAPMVFSLSFMKKNLFRQETISNISTISFFDTAGEDLNTQDTMRTENKYIYNSSGILLLVDPLQISEVRNQLISKGVNLPNINEDTENIVARVAKLIRTALGMSVGKLIDIPIAITFSKIDALSPLLESSSSILGQGNHNGYYNLSDSDNIRTEIENLMEEWAGSHLLQEVKHNFKNYSFFGISALGSNPHGSNKITKLRPIRVEDPFLWLLYKNGIIKGK